MVKMMDEDWRDISSIDSPWQVEQKRRTNGEIIYRHRAAPLPDGRRRMLTGTLRLWISWTDGPPPN